MPSGAAVIRYPGKRGVVWYLKYVDAGGRQVKERLGKAAEGWTKRKAESELRARLVAVEREGYQRPEPTTFRSFAERWLEEYPEARGLKRSTTRGYEQIIENHLVPAFGRLRLSDVSVGGIEAWLASKRHAGLGPGTLNRCLNVLSLVLRAAQRQGLVRDNPVALVDRPREPRRRWRILSPVEVLGVERAFDELVREGEGDRDRDDRGTARVLFLTFMGTGVRRGEAFGLRWRSVSLADPEGPFLRVEENLGPARRRDAEVGSRGADDRARPEAGVRAVRAPGPVALRRRRRACVREPAHRQRVRRRPVYRATPARAQAGRDRRLRSSGARSPPLLDHERGGGRDGAGGADEPCRPLVDHHDAALHRPRRRKVPRGGRPARGAAVGRDRY
jgi:integrase